MHDELARNPGWRVFGSWPRWHPVPGSEADLAVTAPDGSRSWLRGTLHESVLVRAEAYLAARRLDLCPVPPGGVTLQVLGSREWDCMGVILESGVTYRLSWPGGAWRDAMKPPCGPAGQRDAGLLDPARWAFRFRRRLPHEDWMRLCIAVAHPRDWPLREFGLRQALDYLFWHDPRELRRQVLPVGKALEGAERSVLLRNGHPSAGLLYAFANDLWQTAGNNSGALVLRIERVEPAPGAIVNAIDARGHWRAERDGVPLDRS
jgi:hypothetical protein